VSDRTVRCWGNDLDGELGIGMTGSVTPVTSPVEVLLAPGM